MASSCPITAVCLVEFDKDEGQRVEAVHPPDALTPEELRDVAFCSFPDSMSFELQSCSSVRDSAFHFRLRRRAPDGAPAPSFLHGWCLCRQRKDDSLPRGGEQRSCVVLSPFPVPALLRPVAQYAAPQAFHYGAPALARVWTEVACWPPLAWGSHMALPLGPRSSLSVELPEASTLPIDCLPIGATGGAGDGTAVGAAAAGEAAAGEAAARAAAAAWDNMAALVEELDPDLGIPLCLLPQAYGQQEPVLGPFDDCDCWSPLRAVARELWTLWELVLLGEPLMVLSPTPGACSAAVAALLSLATPLPAPDFRPYLTIHDPAFTGLASGARPSADNGLPSLLGATNLHFLHTLPSFPNVLATGFTPATQLAAWGSTGSEGLPRPTGSGGANGSSSSTGSMHSAASSGRLAGLLARRPSRPQDLLQGGVDAAWLSYKPLSRPDHGILGRMVQPAESDPPGKAQHIGIVNSGILRRHFQARCSTRVASWELSKALLFPLLPYITPAQPPVGAAGSGQPPPPLPELDPEALLESLAGRDARLPEVLLQRFGGQRGVVAFYERLLASRSLQAWLAQRREVAAAWQAEAWQLASLPPELAPLSPEQTLLGLRL